MHSERALAQGRSLSKGACSPVVLGLRFVFLVSDHWFVICCPSVHHRLHLPRIRDRLVFVAVVEKHVRLARPRGDLLDPGNPLPKLFARVKVVETLSCRNAAFLPRLSVPAVEPDKADLRRRFHHRRHARPETLWLVHADQRQVIVPQEGQGPVPVFVVHPRIVPKLNGNPVEVVTQIDVNYTLSR